VILTGSKRSLNRLEAENRESRKTDALPIFFVVCPQLNFVAMQFYESNPTSSWRSTAALYEQGYQIGTLCITRKLRFYTMLHSWAIRDILASRYSHSQTFPLPVNITRKISIQTARSGTPGMKDTASHRCFVHICVSLLHFSLLEYIECYDIRDIIRRKISKKNLWEI